MLELLPIDPPDVGKPTLDAAKLTNGAFGASAEFSRILFSSLLANSEQVKKSVKEVDKVGDALAVDGQQFDSQGEDDALLAENDTEKEHILEETSLASDGGDEERRSALQMANWGEWLLPLHLHSDQKHRKVYANYEAAGLPKKNLSELVQFLQHSVREPKQALRMVMHTRELGEITFDVKIQGKSVSVHATVQNEQGAAALGLALSDLRDMLALGGLTLARLDVTIMEKADAVSMAQPIASHGMAANVARTVGQGNTRAGYDKDGRIDG